MGGEFTNQEWDQALNGFDTHSHMALGFLRGGHSGRGASSGFFVREWVHSNGRIHASGPRTAESGKALSAQRRCDWPRDVRGENKKQILPIPRGKTTSEKEKKETDPSYSRGKLRRRNKLVRNFREASWLQGEGFVSLSPRVSQGERNHGAEVFGTSEMRGPWPQGLSLVPFQAPQRLVAVS